MEPDKKGFFKDTQQLAEDYVRERFLLLKLEAAEKTAKLASILITGFIIILFSFFIILFLSIIGGYYLVELTGNWYLAFGIITFIYIVIVVLLISFRKAWLYKYISNSVIRIFFEQTDPK